MVVETKNIDNTGLQEAVANSLVDSKLSKESSTKPLYIVRAQDPTVPAKHRIYAAIRISEDAVTATLKGFELDLDNANKLTTISEALELAKQGNFKIIEKRIPWLKILDIENRSYKAK